MTAQVLHIPQPAATGQCPGEPAWSIEGLALLISEAVANHNDVDGVNWRGVAREVAGALGLAQDDAPQAATGAR